MTSRSSVFIHWEPLTQPRIILPSLPGTQHAVNILVCWCLPEDKGTKEKARAPVSRCRQWEVCVFVCTRRLRRVGSVNVLATHTTNRSHRPRKLLPGQLALSWWQRRLSRNQSPPCLPAAPLHRFVGVGVCVRVWQRKPVSARPERVFMCVPCWGFSRFNLPKRLEIKKKSGGIFEISQSSYQKPSRWWERGCGFWTTDTGIKSGWSIRFCCVCRMNMIMKAARLLKRTVSWESVSIGRKLWGKIIFLGRRIGIITDMSFCLFFFEKNEAESS